MCNVLLDVLCIHIHGLCFEYFLQHTAIIFFALYCIHTNHEAVQNIKCTLCVAESVSIKDNYGYMNLASLKLQ